MSFFVEDRGGSFESTPPGMHLARCYRIVDLGTQKTEYMGQVKFLHKIMLGWEIHGTDDSGKEIKMRDGRPFAIFKNYTLSWSDKANLSSIYSRGGVSPSLMKKCAALTLKTSLARGAC